MSDNDGPKIATDLPRPPLGVMPRWLWCEQRITELARAIIRAEDNHHHMNSDVIARYAKEIRDVLNFAEDISP